MVKQKRFTRNATIIGAFLGFGAPCGYIIYSFFLLNPAQLGFFDWFNHVVLNQWVLLIYLTAPTIVVFALFGFYNGIQEQRLALKKQQMEEFLHIAAHDIRLPLFVMKSAAELLQGEGANLLTEDQTKIVRILHDQSVIMSDLVGELLDIHRMESSPYRLELRPIKLKELIDKAIKETSLLIDEKSASVKLDFDVPEDTTIYVDSFRFRQAIRNVLDNAVRHIPEKGVIEVRAFRNTQGQMEITFANNGPHIPEDKLSTIFDKFVQAHSYDQPLGIGLGLTLCKNIIDLHHGRIWAENLQPEGVCFHISLPNQTKNNHAYS